MGCSCMPDSNGDKKCTSTHENPPSGKLNGKCDTYQGVSNPSNKTEGTGCNTTYDCCAQISSDSCTFMSQPYNSVIEPFESNDPFKLSFFELNGVYNITNNVKSNPLDKWINQQEYGPVSKYQEIVDKYGKPHILVNQPNGLCIWNKFPKGDPHVRIELKDEYVAHCAPAKHHDFLYSFVKIYIPPEKLSDVQSISGSVNYDPLKHELFARCASFQANFATLRTVFNTLDEESTDYSTNINQRDQTYITNEEYVKKKVIENQKKYKKELTWSYYPGAFPDGCP